MGAPANKLSGWWECLWCHEVCHSDCLRTVLGKRGASVVTASDVNVCTLGPYARFCIPPNELVSKDGKNVWTISKAFTSARAYALAKGQHWLSPKRTSSEQQLKRIRTEDSFELNHETSSTDATSSLSTEMPIVALVNDSNATAADVHVAAELRKVLNPIQVWVLQPGTVEPEMVLNLLSFVPNLRVFGCGGDGTAAWCADAAHAWNHPFAVLPLGTGNDLARSALLH